MQTFSLKPGEHIWVAGPNQDTQFNAVADFGTAVLTLAAAKFDDGSPIVLNPSSFTLAGNQPFVRGPIQAFGTLGQLGVTTPCSLYLENSTPPQPGAIDVWGPVITVTLH